MSKKIIGIIAVMIILAGAGIYFGLNRQPSSPSHKITDFEEIEQNLPPASVPITISGETTCLPKTGQGAQTMECAMGLKGTDGRHYGLKNLFKLDPEYKFSVGGLRVEVSGTFSPEEIKGSDGNKYDVVGVIDVTSIKEIGD